MSSSPSSEPCSTFPLALACQLQLCHSVLPHALRQALPGTRRLCANRRGARRHRQRLTLGRRQLKAAARGGSGQCYPSVAGLCGHHQATLHPQSSKKKIAKIIKTYPINNLQPTNHEYREQLTSLHLPPPVLFVIKHAYCLLLNSQLSSSSQGEIPYLHFREFRRCSKTNSCLKFCRV